MSDCQVIYVADVRHRAALRRLVAEARAEYARAGGAGRPPSRVDVIADALALAWGQGFRTEHTATLARLRRKTKNGGR